MQNTIDARTLATALAVLEWARALPPSAPHQPPVPYSVLLNAGLEIQYALQKIKFEATP